MTRGAFHLLKISGISGSAVNGTRFVGSSHWKIPRKSGKSKKVVPFSRLEFPNGISCSIYVSRSLYQFQVHGRAPPCTGVYDQMEQLFTNRKFHFCYHRNFRVFFLNGKRPSLTTVNSAKDFLLSIFLFVLSTHYSRVNSSIANWIALYYWAPTEFFERKPNVLSAFINRNENCVLQTQLSLTR